MSYDLFKVEMSEEDIDIIDEMRKRYDFCKSYFAEMHDQMYDDQEFYNGNQWSDEDIMKRAGRPTQTFNQLKKYVSLLYKQAKDSNPSIKAKSSNSKNKRTTQVFNSFINDIEQLNMASEIYMQAVQNACICGLGGFYYKLDYKDNKSFKKQLKMFPIENPFSFYFDPDFNGSLKNISFAFITREITLDEFEIKYPDALSQKSDYFLDKMTSFSDEDDDITLVDYFYKEYKDKKLYLMKDGTVLSEKDLKETTQYDKDDVEMERTFSDPVVVHIISNGVEILERTELDIKYIPVVPVFGEKNNMSGKLTFEGIVRQLKDAQYEYNYFANIALEMASKMVNGKMLVPEGTMEKYAEDYYNMYSSNNPILQYKTSLDGTLSMPQFVSQNLDISSIMANLSAIQDKMNSITGIYGPSLGEGNTGEISGVAVLAKQNQSKLSNYKYVDNLNNSLIYAGYIVLEYIPYLIDETTSVTIKDSATNKEETVNLSEDSDVDFSLDDFNIYIEVGDFDETERQNGIKLILSLASSMPEAMMPLVADVIAKNSDFLGSDVLEDRFKKYLLPQELREDGELFIPPEVQQQIEAEKMQYEGQIEQLNIQLQQLSEAIVSYKIQNSNLTSELNNEKQRSTSELIKQEAENKKILADRAFKTAEMFIKSGENVNSEKVRHFLSIAFDEDLSEIITNPVVNETVVVPGINDQITKEQEKINQLQRMEEEDSGKTDGELFDEVDEKDLDSILNAMNIIDKNEGLPDGASGNMPMRTSVGNR